MDLDLLQRTLDDAGDPSFRAGQVWAWTARGAGGYQAMTDLRIRIVAALVNPHGGDQGRETVTLLNVTDAEQALTGWALANRNKAQCPLAGVVAAGATVTFTLPVNVPLSNEGGLITLLDASGLKVHGVSYTNAQAARQGWTVAF